jgi:hypothetical protein
MCIFRPREYTLPEQTALLSAASIRQSLENTRQRGVGELYIVNDLFAECITSDARQSFAECHLVLGKEKIVVTATSDSDRNFTKCTHLHSAKPEP